MKKISYLLLGITFILAACGPANPASPTTTQAPAWIDASFTDARTGQTFSINGFKGKVVLVETMAVWCTNCRAQQGQIMELHSQLGPRSDLVTVSLDIDPNEDASYLQTYVNSTSFDWLYAVSGKSVASEIGQLYGAQFLNPTSTPMLIVDKQGQVHTLPFGIKSADQLQSALEPYLN
jgi:thiol-disulfide isomerase/thioredoxin